MTVTGMKEVPKSIHHSGHVWQAAGFLATMMKVTEGGGGGVGGHFAWGQEDQGSRKTFSFTIKNCEAHWLWHLIELAPPLACCSTGERGPCLSWEAQ